MPPLPPWARTYTDFAHAGVPMSSVAQIGPNTFLACTAGQLVPPIIGGRIFRSSLDGACWTIAATLPNVNDQFTLVSRLPFGTPNAALLGGALLVVGVGYVATTADGGATWPLSAPDPLDVFGICHILLGLSASDWVGLGVFSPGAPNFYNVITSGDGGATWTNIGVTIPQPASLGLGQAITAGALLSDGSIVCGGCRPSAPDVWTTFRSLGPPWNVWTASTPFPGTYPLGFNGLTQVLSIADIGGGVVLATLGPAITMTDGAGDNPIWVYRSTDSGQTWALLDPLVDIANAPFFPLGSPHMTATAGALLALGGGDVVLGLGGFQTPGDNPLWAPGWRVSHDNGLTFPDQGTALNDPGGSAFWAQPLAMAQQSAGGVISVCGGLGSTDPMQEQIWSTFASVPPCPGGLGPAAHFRSRTAPHQAPLSVSRRAHGARG